MSALAQLVRRARSVSPLALASGISMINSLTIAVLFARLGGPEAFGSYQIALAAAGSLGVMTIAGASSAAMRAAAQARRAAWPLFRLRLPFCFIATLVLLFVSVVVAMHGSDALGASLAAAAVTLPLALGGDVFPAQLMGEERYGSYLAFQSFVQGLTVVGVAGTLVIAPDRPWASVLAMTGITGVIQLAGLLSVRSSAEIDPGDRRYALQLTKVSLLTVAAARLDVLATGSLLGAREAGLVGVARTLSLVPRRLWDVLHPVFFTRLAAGDAASGLAIANRFRFPLTLVLGVPCAVGIAASPWLVPRVFGSEFDEAVTVAQLLLLAAAVAPLGFLEAVYLKARGDVRRLGIAYVGLPLLSLGLLPPLVVLLGVEGVGVATLVGSIVSVPAFVVLARRHAAQPSSDVLPG